MSQAVLERTTLKVGSNNYENRFIAKGEILVFDGFLKDFLWIFERFLMDFRPQNQQKITQKSINESSQWHTRTNQKNV